MALIQAAQNRKKTNTGGLAKLLNSKIGAKVMLTVNKDIRDRLINGQTEIIRHIEYAQASARKVYVKFSDEWDGSKEMGSSYLGWENSWIPIEVSIKKGSASPFIKRTQFLVTAWASTVHKFQGLSLEQGVNWFWSAKITTIWTRINVYCAQ